MNPNAHRNTRFPLVSLLIGAAVALLAAGLVTAKLASEPAEHISSSPALGVQTLAVEKVQGYALRRIFTGQVEANRVSGLGFERAGLLLEVLVREGDAVRADQVVARLDTALLEAKRRELAAALDDAGARLSLAEATLRRYRDSVDDGAVTRQALDEAQEGRVAAQAQVDAAGARIASVDLDIAKSELRAPFDGIVTNRRADEGRVLQAGHPVLELQERTVPEIRVGLAGGLADTLRPGEEYALSWHGRKLSARLRSVLPVRRPGTRTRDALFESIDPPNGLHAGELVELELSHWLDEEGFWLPLSALAVGYRGLWQAYVTEPLNDFTPNELSADHRIAPRPVEVLYQEGERIFVRGSLLPGDRVVSAGLQRVVPGQLVRVLPDVAESVAMEAE